MDRFQNDAAAQSVERVLRKISSKKAEEILKVSVVGPTSPGSCCLYWERGEAKFSTDGKLIVNTVLVLYRLENRNCHLALLFPATWELSDLVSAVALVMRMALEPILVQNVADLP